MIKQDLYGLSFNVTNPVLSLTAAATTVTVGTAFNPTIGGSFGTQVSAAAKTFALVDSLGAAVTPAPTLVATATSGQACTLVHCFNSAGTYQAIKGPTVNINVAGDFSDELEFPSVPDTLMAAGYSTIKNPVGSSTATFTFGTTNWNATSIVTTTVNVCTMPARPLVTA